jgi:2-polyprenyl-3-methyl-5-hydroxy-6-metoxy-1,4-benzoquinol methylase
MPDFYSQYVAFKGWKADGAPDRSLEFAALLGAHRPQPGARVLEFGFGNGEFLDWGREGGLRMEGVEIIPDLVAAAAARGHAVHLSTTAGLEAGAYDRVVAIDMLEHLSTDEILAQLTESARLLCAGGLFIARFPNGASPFSGYFQRGDATHRSVLSPDSLRQIGALAGLELVASFNPRPRSPGLAGALKRGAAYAARDLIETVIGYAYFGRRVPMDPNVVVILRKPPAA